MFLQSRAEISSCTVPALCLLKLLPFFALSSLPLFCRSFSSLSFLSFFLPFFTTLSLGEGGGGRGLDLLLFTRKRHDALIINTDVFCRLISARLTFATPVYLGKRHPIRCCVEISIVDDEGIERNLDIYFERLKIPRPRVISFSFESVSLEKESIFNEERIIYFPEE